MSMENPDTKLWRYRAFPMVSVLLIGCVIPLLAGWAVLRFFPDWRWEHIAFHSFVEAFGALMALGIAGFLLLRFDKKGYYRLWLACSMLTMGILDGVHAAVNPGLEFVWLHSSATFVGGIFMAMIWLPERFAHVRRARWLPRVLVTATVLFALISLSFPAVVPAMVNNGQFTPIAETLNIAGGILFFIGAAFFLRRFYCTGSKTQLLFLALSLLFGVAGVTFESSVLWDSGWWMWHLMRLAAYVIALGYIITNFASDYQRTIRAEEALRNRRNNWSSTLPPWSCPTRPSKSSIRLRNRRPRPRANSWPT